MTVIQSHCVMGTDVVRVPDGTKLASLGLHDDFTSIRIVTEDNEPAGSVFMVGDVVGTTVPTGYIEIYSEASQ